MAAPKEKSVNYKGYRLTTSAGRERRSGAPYGQWFGMVAIHRYSGIQRQMVSTYAVTRDLAVESAILCGRQLVDGDRAGPTV